MSATRILLVDDFLPWQRWVLSMFESEPDLKLVSVASDGLEAVQKAKQIRPDVVLMDLSLPERSGFEATREIRIFSPNSKILFLTEHRGADLIRAAFDLGVSGYILKSDANADLVRGIWAVLVGQQFVSRSLRDWQETSGSPG